MAKKAEIVEEIKEVVVNKIQPLEFADLNTVKDKINEVITKINE